MFELRVLVRRPVAFVIIVSGFIQNLRVRFQAFRVVASRDCHLSCDESKQQLEIFPRGNLLTTNQGSEYLCQVITDLMCTYYN